MELKTILAAVDHTLLKQESTWADIQTICDDAMKYHTASVCIPACYVAQAAEYMKGRADAVKVCTVIGFPNGYSTTKTKCFEAEDAVTNGAEEIDMVINVGMLKEGRDEDVLAEINAVKAACHGRLLKVIIETCLLTEDEKIRACRLVTEGGADYIKTSTGFAKAGADLADIALFRQHIGSGVKIKAAGGIRTREQMEAFLAAGCDRIGCSAAKILFDCE